MLLLLLLLWGVKGVEGGPELHQGFTLSVQREVVVQEGLCIFVPCEFHAREEWTDSDLIHGYWFRYGEHDSPVATNNPLRPALKETLGRFSLLGDPQKNNCSLDIRETRKEDTGTYFFRLERGKLKFNYLWNTMTLNVTGQQALLSTVSFSLRCSKESDCDHLSKSSLSRNHWTIPSEAPRCLHQSVSTLTPPDLHMSLDHHRQVPLLLISLHTGSVSFYTEYIILKNGSSLPVSEGQSLRLFCSTDSNPPANLSWTWGNLSLCPSKLLEPGLLELFPVHLKHEGMYTCQAQHALGSQHISLSLYPQSSTTLSEMTMGAFVGSGTTVFLLLLRSYRRRPARPAIGAPDSNALKGSVSQSPLVKPQADGSSELLPPTAEAAPSSTEEEAHYASLSFHEMQPRNPQGTQVATEYSEIKFHK
uniref:Sialic acid binding Ig-like lectin E n=1 Tax=Cricetulus griseus TaxID=10029 RepID=A0A8C2QHI1_CRIGR